MENTTSHHHGHGVSNCNCARRFLEVYFQATCLALLVALFFTFALSQNCGGHGESDTPLSLRTLAPSGSPSFCGEPELSVSIKLLVSSS